MMEYDPKIIPEGINVSEEHPVREFAVLVGSIGIAIVAIVYLLVISSDYLIRFMPAEKENEWFPQKMFTELGDNKINSREDTNKKLVEKYILSLVDSLEDEELKGFKFTITLVESDEPNAFNTPGGHILSLTGC